MKTLNFITFKFYLLITILFAVIISSCSKVDTTGSSSLYIPTNADTTANASLTDLKNGRTLYINNCGNCHNLYPPEDFTVAQWKSILPRMAQNTNLSAPDLSLITKYVCKGKE